MPAPMDAWTSGRLKAALYWAVLFPLAFAHHLLGRVRGDAPKGKLLPRLLGLGLIWLAGTFVWGSLVLALAGALSEWRSAIPDTMRQM